MSLSVPPSTGLFSNHKANCHCGTIQLSFKISPPLDKYPVVSCNCSICQRNGYLLVYPERDNITIESGPEGVLGCYSFGHEVVSHKFCKNCGSSVFWEFTNGPPDAGHERPKMPNVVGVNVRMITGAEPEDLTISKVDFMRNFGPKYDP